MQSTVHLVDHFEIPNQLREELYSVHPPLFVCFHPSMPVRYDVNYRI